MNWLDQARESEPRAILRLLGPIVVLVGAMLLLPVGDVRPTTNTPVAVFGTLDTLTAMADQLVGETLLVVGALCWLVGLRVRVGLLAVLAGLCWFGPDFYGHADVAPLLRATGRFLLAPMLWPLLLHLGAATLGLDGRRPVLVILALAYAATAAVAVGTAITYDANFDIWCGSTSCTFDNPFLVIHRVVGGVRRWRGLGTAVLAVVAVATLSTSILWLRLAHRRDASHLAVATGLLFVGAVGLARAVMLARDPSEDLNTPAWQWCWAFVAAAVLVLALGVGAVAVAHQRRMSRMRRFAETLDAAPTPGTLEGVLRQGLGDTGLRIGYCLDDGTTVDAAGTPWTAQRDGANTTSDNEPGGRAQTVTPVERDGVRLALIEHAGTVDPVALAAAFTPTVLIAVDNERLRAARLAQLAELRASRTRIVAVGDTERRRLERDLHDGVQQHLLSLLFDVRLAQLAADPTRYNERAARLADAEARVRVAVDELRRIAHGIHPAVLSRSGLLPALQSLADEAPLPVELDGTTVGRLPEAVEEAAYQAVVDAVSEASAVGAPAVSVAASTDRGMLRLTVAQPGPSASSPGDVPVRIADRVGAAGGTATVERLPQGGRLLRVELPCA